MLPVLDTSYRLLGWVNTSEVRLEPSSWMDGTPFRIFVPTSMRKNVERIYRGSGEIAKIAEFRVFRRYFQRSDDPGWCIQWTALIAVSLPEEFWDVKGAVKAEMLDYVSEA